MKKTKLTRRTRCRLWLIRLPLSDKAVEELKEVMKGKLHNITLEPTLPTP